MRNPVTLYHGALIFVLATAGGLLVPVGALWWIFGPKHLRTPRSLRRRPGRAYRFRDGQNRPY